MLRMSVLHVFRFVGLLLVSLTTLAVTAAEASKEFLPVGPALSRQYLTAAERTPIVKALLAHAEDAADHNLRLMYWFAAEPIVAAAPAKVPLLLAKTKIPLLREYITRGMTAGMK